MSVVGWVGLGRLGAPCAAALAHHGGHTVVGYDVRELSASSPLWEGLPPVKMLESIERVVAETDRVVFVAVQTPHAPAYGGDRITPNEPHDFEYGYLVQAVRDVASAALALRKYVDLVIVSTVLPGTFDRELRSLLNLYVTPIYHPFFIAMGTVVDDFLRPEMTLFGVDVEGHEDGIRELYASLHDVDAVPAPVVSIASAELAKVAYNTFISAKIVFANALAQLADATGADVDEVTDALALGADRITSSRYMRAGVGDGGACHPRDNVALSALARRVGAEDLMGYLTRARENQTRWLARLAARWADQTGLELVILGDAYKPGIALTDGSPARLLGHALNEDGYTYLQYDPVVSDSGARGLVRHLEQRRSVYVIATAHQQFRSLPYLAGSVVIDPFGYVKAPQGVTLVTPGRRGGIGR